MELVQKILAFYNAHAADIAVFLVALALFLRKVSTWTETTKDDTWSAAFNRFLELIGIRIPPTASVTAATVKAVDKVEAAADVAVAKVEDAAPSPIPVAIPVVRQFDTGEALAPDAFGARPPAGRRLMRLHVRRTARRHGLEDVADWDDEQIDEVLDRADLKAREMSGGILQDLFAWIIAHPEELLAIIKFLLAIFAAEPKAKAGKAAAK